MAFKFRVPRKPYSKLSVPGFPSVTSADEPEQLMGMVQGKTASAPEERLARALDKAGINYEFRYVVGAPKGLPGWKELDILAQYNGVLYAMEVDTAFTHRTKAASDVLHDAIVLNDPEIQAMGEVWQTVIHVDGDNELANNANSRAFVRQLFGR